MAIMLWSSVYGRVPVRPIKSMEGTDTWQICLGSCLRLCLGPEDLLSKMGSRKSLRPQGLRELRIAIKLSCDRGDRSAWVRENTAISESLTQYPQQETSDHFQWILITVQYIVEHQQLSSKCLHAYSSMWCGWVRSCLEASGKAGDGKRKTFRTDCKYLASLV